MNNDVRGTIMGFISSFLGSMLVSDLAKDLAMAFLFGAAGAAGGFIMTHKIIPFLITKYNQYVKTTHKP